jgi:hypothetical protein
MGGGQMGGEVRWVEDEWVATDRWRQMSGEPDRWKSQMGGANGVERWRTDGWWPIQLEMQMLHAAFCNNNKIGV